MEIQTDSHSDFRTLKVTDSEILMATRSAILRLMGSGWATQTVTPKAIRTVTQMEIRTPRATGSDSVTVIRSVTHWPMDSNWAIRTGFRSVIHWVIPKAILTGIPKCLLILK